MKKKRSTEEKTFGECLAEAFHAEFPGCAIETNYSIMAFRHITERLDEKPFTKQQVMFIRAFENGYRAKESA